MPLLSQAAVSSASIPRDASEMSVSPAQNFSNPPPVPEVPTVTRTPEFCSWNSSAAASLSGATVLEPSMLIVPDSWDPPSADPPSLLPPPQAAANIPMASSSAPQRQRATSRPVIRVVLPHARRAWAPVHRRVAPYDAHGSHGA